MPPFFDSAAIDFVVTADGESPATAKTSAATTAASSPAAAAHHLAVAMSAPSSAARPTHRLDHILLHHLSHSAAVAAPPSRAAIQRWVAGGHVSVDGQPALRSGARLRPGQCVSVHIPAAVPSSLVPIAMPLDLLFEDATMLAINKPAHLPVHPGAGVHRATLVHGLLAMGGGFSGIGGVMRPGIVHRLDAGTTGIVLVAKTDAAHQALSRQFAARSVQKTYLALVCGPWPRALADAGLLDTFYGRHPKLRKRFTGRLGNAPKRAKTAYQRLRSQTGPAPVLHLLELHLLTGRTHQARVHCAEMGLPLLGDAVYGSRSANRFAQKVNLTHQALHAARISFAHPDDGRPITLSAPPPTDWWSLAEALDAERS